MNIWVEYFRSENSKKNTWAQIRENTKWNPPNPDKISRRGGTTKIRNRSVTTHHTKQGVFMDPGGPCNCECYTLDQILLGNPWNGDGSWGQAGVGNPGEELNCFCNDKGLELHPRGNSQ